MTTQAMLDYAEQNGYDLVAITDHLSYFGSQRSAGISRRYQI